MKHTPTPYRKGKQSDVVVADVPEGATDRRADADLVEHYGGYIIFESCNPDDIPNIIKSCNVHEKHVAQIQHLDSAVRAQASTITALLQSLKETLDIVHDEICAPLAKLGGGCSIVHTEAKKAIALAEGQALKEPYEKPGIRAGTPDETD